MEGLLFRFQGDGAELNIYENRVIIIRKNTQGDTYKYIHFKDIESVEIMPAGKNKGRIEFVITKRQNVNLSAEQEKLHVEIRNTKIKEQNLKAFEIKAYIDEQILKHENCSLLVEEIKKFYELFQEGIITQEEFDIKKKQLLNL